MKRAHPKCVHVRTEGQRYHVSSVRTHFYVVVLWCLFYLQKFYLTFIQKGCACQKWLFLSNEISFYFHKTSVFYFKLCFRTKVSQNIFNFNQIDLIIQCDTLLLKKTCAAQHEDLFDKLFYIDIYRVCFIQSS